MRVEYHKWYSDALGQDMDLKIYGEKGLPFVIFPAMGGPFFEFEDLFR